MTQCYNRTIKAIVVNSLLVLHFMNLVPLEHLVIGWFIGVYIYGAIVTL